jgi:hypothetical protein
MSQLVTLNYNDLTVLFQSEDAYLNATLIAKQFGKKTENYLRTDSTKEYLTALEKHLNSIAPKSVNQQNQLVTVKVGAPENGGGTWLHPKLSIHFARWLNADFGVWCDMEIEKMLQPKQTPIAITMTPKTAIPYLEGYLDAAKLFQIPLHLAQIESAKLTFKDTNIDFSPMLKLASTQDDIPEVEIMLEPTELGKRLGYSAAEMNRVLERLGLQTRPNGKDWIVTDLGKPISFYHSWTKFGKSGYNYKWNVSEVEKLLPKSI